MELERIHTKLTEHALVAIPPIPPRFTLNEWHRTQQLRIRTCLDQQTLADRVIAECDRVIDEVDEKALSRRREVDHNLGEKIQTIQFTADEIKVQRKSIVIEIDNLSTYIERLLDARTSVKEQALKICKKCLLLREGRLGIDLCLDEVECELLKEMDVIEGAQKLLNKVTEQANEQIRRCKSTVYFIDRDLENKGRVLEIDSSNKDLREYNLCLSMYHGFTALDLSNITNEEWEKFTQDNIDRAAKEINSSRQLRSYVDTLLRQITDDLIAQYNAVNAAFKRRIDEIREAKSKLEMQHHEILRQVNEMTLNITRLEKALAEKEGFMALAHTRLGSRAQRPETELCKDRVEINLANDVYELRHDCHLLQHMLAEAQASMRYLLKTQIQLEEDINVKTNTLKIDEVDCMILRQGMDYHAY